MTTPQTAPTVPFDIGRYTQAPVRMDARIRFRNKTPEQVFDILGDPQQIPNWYLLAKEIRTHPPGEDGETSFNVVFTFFGDVYEEVLHWDPPHRYVYLAKGEDFPIKDYIALIEVVETAPGEGEMRWQIYCDQIEGEHFQKILPVILPAINEASIEKLTPLIGGVDFEVQSFF